MSDIDARLRGTSLDGGSTGYLVAHSSAPLVPPQVCKGIIEECEARAVRLGSWSTKRHTNYPTTDVAVQRLPNTLEYFRTKLLPEIAWPFLAKAFGFVLPSPEGEEELAGALRAAEAFIVKYNASAGQKELKPHRDGSVFSFNVALNDLDEYEGGGTEFEALDGKAIRSPRGHLLAHSSALTRSAPFHFSSACSAARAAAPWATGSGSRAARTHEIWVRRSSAVTTPSRSHSASAASSAVDESTF